ncbi:LysR family transcriptional regulator [Pseudonocardia sp. C8]|nr:LysR family transcriptional regulator [Pseudonocardia sp. C8]MBC3194323.1 LysR family transcriptional regulator [Pseudonocardia sp. C8]
MMDRRIQVLRVVHALGTITAAATSLHLTPSAVSQQLRGLAQELGVPLLEPDGRRVRLTPAAHVLLRHADDLAAGWERARAELQSDADLAGGPLRLAGFPSSLDLLVLPTARRLRRTHPRLEVRITQVESAEAFPRLLTEQLDLAVTLPTRTGPSVDDTRYEQVHLLDDPLDLIVPADHPLAGQAGATLDDVAHEPWVLAAPGSCDQHDLVTAACLTAGFSPRIAHEVTDWPLVAAMVGHGFGISLKPRLVPTPSEPALRVIPLRGPGIPHRRLFASLRRGSRDHPRIALGLQALRHTAHTGPVDDSPVLQTA